MLTFSPEREKNSLVQSSVIQNIRMYSEDSEGWILLVFTHFFVKSDQFQIQQFF